MMRYLLALFALVLMAFPSYSMGVKPYVAPTDVDISIENFEDANYTKNPEWWVFGNASLSITGNPAKDRFALSIKGSARDWYVGGIGTYLGGLKKDFSAYSSLEMDIYGHGPKSGTLKMELYQDANGNWQIEKDPKTFEPLFDDKFVYEQKITWDGWKHVSIPFLEFKRANPGVGSGIWNPGPHGSSGGLLEMQFIAVAASKTGTVDFVIDNIEFNGGSKK